jgi:SAM-dependent methyltransferase
VSLYDQTVGRAVGRLRRARRAGLQSRRERMIDRTIPESIDRQALLDCLTTISIDGSAEGALAPYVQQDLERFLLTFNLANVAAKDVLEIGANPYFLTILLKWFRPAFDVEMINFFGGGGGRLAQQAVVRNPPRPGLQTTFEMPYASVDIETQRMPYPDERFDLIFFCEVLEHFIVDPYNALLEIRRCLRTGGWLLLTTPNVARRENLARMIHGHNLYDPYSGHGPHGRHNREYSRHEVAWMLGRLGFEPVTHFTADVHANAFDIPLDRIPLPPHREHDFGQYQFHLWKKKADAASVERPAWLYRSMSVPLDPTPL